jgi:hypothetical protein
MTKGEWRSIETHPKDQVHVLVHMDGGIYLANWDVDLGGWTEDGEKLIGGSPSHWMPLPPLP